MEEPDYEDYPVNWKQFQNTTREYVIFLLFFLFLYVVSYACLSLYRLKLRVSHCYEEAFVHRITLWLCSFSLSISIGAAMLLPISIISNEVLLLYPNSYYVQWLNMSLIQGLWNLVFLFSNLSLFIFLPFSHFILESEGLPGRRGIMNRVNEATLVLVLTGLVIMGIVYILAAMFDGGPYIHPAFSLSSHYFPFLYSCVSFLGVLMLLLCTPLGFGRLFTVMSALLTKRQVCIRMPPITSEREFTMDYAVYRRVYRTASIEDIKLISDMMRAEGDVASADEISEPSRFSMDNIRIKCLYPFVTFILILLTMLAVLTVSQNTLELCFGVKSLPIYSQNIALGISSLSKLGPAGAFIEVVLILYLYCTSIVGFYYLPFFSRLTPVPYETSASMVVGNCVALLVLSSALPVLARSLGITNFDLLGDFGKINWLGNFYIVLFHNIVFAVTVTFFLGVKITAYFYPDKF